MRNGLAMGIAYRVMPAIIIFSDLTPIPRAFANGSLILNLHGWTGYTGYPEEVAEISKVDKKNKGAPP